MQNVKLCKKLENFVTISRDRMQTKHLQITHQSTFCESVGIWSFYIMVVLLVR